MSEKIVQLSYYEYKDIIDEIDRLTKLANADIRIEWRDTLGGRYSSYKIIPFTDSDAIKELELVNERMNGNIERIISDYSDYIDKTNPKLSRLTKLENRNWFERLFNIDM